MHHESNGRAEHTVCGLASLLVVALAFVAGWSAAVAATAWIPVLSTTALVLLGVAVWGVTWLAFESAVVLTRVRRRPSG